MITIIKSQFENRTELNKEEQKQLESTINTKITGIAYDEAGEGTVILYLSNKTKLIFSASGDDMTYLYFTVEEQ